MAVFTAIASVDDVRAFIDEYFEAWSGIDENLILSYYSEDVSLELPGTVINGKAALRDHFVRPFVAGFPGNRHVVKNMIFGKDMVVVEWSFEAAHKGPFAGTVAAGTAVKLPGCGVYQFDPVNRQITAAPYLFRCDDPTQADFLATTSNPAESFDIVVRFTQQSKNNDCGVIPVRVPGPGEANTKVQWTPLAEWRIVLSWGRVNGGSPPNARFCP